MTRLVFALFVLSLWPTDANAGAWTLPRGHWQSFTASTTSQADRSFDSAGHPTVPTRFNKLLFQNCFEYGLTNALTLFAIPAYVIGDSETPTEPYAKVQNASVEAGARLALLAHHGHLSFQASYKSAGSFDLSVSANHESGQQIEMRMLYGTSFKLFGRDGFADFQIAERWIDHPRPNETPIDLTAGLWLRRDTMIMVQSFNIISGGDAVAPYSYYRTHKLEFSVVEQLSRHWALQTGIFYSPAGQNALVEKGVSIVLWTQD